MTRMLLALALSVAVAGGCRQTGDDEYQVEVPDIDVGRDTLNLRVPDIDVDIDTRRDTTDTLRRDTVRRDTTP